MVPCQQNNFDLNTAKCCGHIVILNSDEARLEKLRIDPKIENEAWRLVWHLLPVKP
ncbi:MAG: hypothetical protein RLZZ597_1292 [Cyanobacteriota bacterium]|jgi:hypothetical protein